MVLSSKECESLFNRPEVIGSDLVTYRIGIQQREFPALADVTSIRGREIFSAERVTVFYNPETSQAKVVLYQDGRFTVRIRPDTNRVLTTPRLEQIISSNP